MNPNAAVYNFDIPDDFVSKMGSRVRTSSGTWEIAMKPHAIKLKFSKIQKHTSNQFVDALKLNLIPICVYQSPYYANNILNNFSELIKHIHVGDVIDTITEKDLYSYRNSLSPEREWCLGSISGFLRNWHQSGVPGIDANAERLLSKLRLKGNIKGKNVSNFSETNGPFNDLQFEIILRDLGQAYLDGIIKPNDYFLINCFARFGMRPIQCASLMCSDLIKRESNGTIDYWLRIPRAKQRNSKFRGAFKYRALPQDFGVQLSQHISRQIKFFDITCLDSASLFRIEFGSDNSLCRSNIARIFTNVFSKLSKHFNREYGNINPRRFRYTIATRAASEGHGELVIAELLDHNDTQNVGPYVKATDKIINRIESTLFPYYENFIGAFQGNLTNRNEFKKDIKSSTIGSINVPETPIGHCNKGMDCFENWPISCYTCRSLNAWMDAPHEENLEAMISERDRLLSIGCDERIASINDLAIYACKEIIENIRASHEK